MLAALAQLVLHCVAPHMLDNRMTSHECSDHFRAGLRLDALFDTYLSQDVCNSSPCLCERFGPRQLVGRASRHDASLSCFCLGDLPN